MDALSGFLHGPRAQGAFLLRSVMDPPWSLRVQDRAPLTVVAVTQGTACITPEQLPTRALSTGDIALVRGDLPYTVADSPETPAQVVIHPGQVCTTVEGAHVAEAMGQGVRTWGNTSHGRTELLTGTYTGEGEVSRMLVQALPRMVVLGRDDWECPAVDLLTTEITKDEPGQDAVLDRLLDLIVVAALRAWFARPEARAPAWYAAQGDPVVGPALRLLQHDPAHPWTVASLAAQVNVSRAALARRFTGLVGEPPISFLTRWRLALAADLLLAPDTTVTAVARQVGYPNPFTFSTAFKRRFGHSPREHRATTAPTPPPPLSPDGHLPETPGG